MVRFSKEEVSSWPTGHKKCSICLEIKTLDCFKKESKLLFGVSSSCRECKNSGKYRPWTRWTEEEISAWPENYKKCIVCKNLKHFSAFHKNKNCLFGLNTTCSECRGYNSKVQWQHNKSTKPEYYLWNSARSRSNKRGLEFSILVEDIVIPDVCPIFKVKMIPKTDYAPSLDRKDPSKGYTKDNIAVISRRANIIKNNASSKELRAIANWIDEEC